MNRNVKLFIGIIGVLIICGGSLALGAISAQDKQTQQVVATEKQNSIELAKKLTTEQPTITAVLSAAYPKSATDYTMSSAKLYDKGQWFGAILTYKGSDSMNRDTLRVLMQKKNGVWILRTTPPELLLSAKKYPDIPKSILQSINKPVSLPGTDNSPVINPAE